MTPADGMVPGQGFEGGWLREGLADDARLECGVCWRVYDPVVGDRAGGIAAGTPFLALPDHWTCPECQAAREKFMVIDPGKGPRRGPSAQTMQTRLDQLLNAYRDADLAMASLPIYNPRLRISARGFREADGAYVGALLTPWFLNLVRLPADKTQDVRSSGDSLAVSFPSGSYAFSVATLERVGSFEFLSLFSPVQEFEDQAAAMSAADAAVEALFAAPSPADAKAPPQEDPRQPSRRTLLMGRNRPKHGAPP